MQIYNSLSRKIEELQLGNQDSVGIYTCGPTVYNYVTIGNWRTYTLGDLVVRALKYFGYEVNYVMNITDVGHLTGDNLGDASTGDDRLEKAASKEGKTAWEVAAHYTNDFLYWYEKLNLVKPEVFCKATDHINEQIDLVQKIEQAGLIYQIVDGIYFDVKKYEESGNVYGQLSTLDQIKAGARVEVNEEKKDPRDFALWKFSKPEEKRHMEWDSPWGRGFPGWHIECSAMSIKYLGEQFNIHIGGEDLRSTHHPNEIVQSEVATGKVPFVKYWLHGAFLLVNGGRMGKSLGNAYTVKDLVDRGFSPLALRYFYLTGHYRKQLNFTWEGLEAASNALDGLYEKAEVFGKCEVNELKISENIKETLNKFNLALEDDLNMPMALGIVHEGIANSKNDNDLMYLLMVVDQVLGLDLVTEGKERFQKNREQNEMFGELLKKRDGFRKNKQWNDADKIRVEIESRGYEIEDTPEGARVKKI